MPSGIIGSKCKSLLHPLPFLPSKSQTSCYRFTSSAVVSWLLSASFTQRAHIIWSLEQDLDMTVVESWCIFQLQHMKLDGFSQENQQPQQKVSTRFFVFFLALVIASWAIAHVTHELNRHGFTAWIMSLSLTVMAEEVNCITNVHVQQWGYCSINYMSSRTEL